MWLIYILFFCSFLARTKYPESLFDLDENNSKYTSTPIHEAAEAGHLEVIKFLIQYAENPNGGNVDGKTPIHFAAEEGMSYVFCLLSRLVLKINCKYIAI